MRKAIFLCVKTWIMMQLLPLFVALLVKDYTPDLGITVHYCVQIVVMYLIMLAWALYLKKKNRIDFKFSFSDIPDSGKYLIRVFLGAIGLALSMRWLLWIPLLSEVTVPPGFTEEEFVQLHESVPMLMAIGIWMPIIEEILFRGALQKRFISFLGTKKGILLGAVFFGFLHGKKFGFAMLVAGALGYIYLKTDNLLYPILFHISINMTDVLLAVTGAAAQPSHVMICVSVGICILGIGVAVWKRISKKEQLQE